MTWYRINLKTWNSYLEKHNITDIKVIIEDSFDGNSDCLMPVKAEGNIQAKEITDYDRTIYYDKDIGKLRSISVAVGSFTIIDDRFNELLESTVKKMLADGILYDNCAACGKRIPKGTKVCNNSIRNCKDYLISYINIKGRQIL